MNSFNNFFNQNDERYVDIPLETDIELYLDPSQINQIETPHFDSKMARRKVSGFFQHVFDLFLQNEREKSMKLIVEPREINATHLGMSSGPSEGNGPSEHILEETFEKLVELADKNVNLWSQPILIPLFVPGFGKDRFSDLLTCIILKELCEFTFNICKDLEINVYPKMFKYYDIDEQSWLEKEFLLPIGPDGKHIVLVPKNLVTKDYSFSAQSYVWKIIFSKRQNYHMRNQTSLVQTKEIKGEMVMNPPTKTTIYKKEVVNQYKKDKLKQYALNQTIEEPDSLEHYIRYVDEQLKEE